MIKLRARKDKNLLNIWFFLFLSTEGIAFLCADQIFCSIFKKMAPCLVKYGLNLLPCLLYVQVTS